MPRRSNDDFEYEFFKETETPEEYAKRRETLVKALGVLANVNGVKFDDLKHLIVIDTPKQLKKFLGLLPKDIPLTLKKDRLWVEERPLVDNFTLTEELADILLHWREISKQGWKAWKDSRASSEDKGAPASLISGLVTEIRDVIEFTDKQRRALEKAAADFSAKVSQFTQFVRKYTYAQLKGMQEDLGNLKAGEVDSAIQKELIAKFPQFVEYLALQGLDLTPDDKNTVFEFLLLESEPIRNELRDLIRTHEDEARREAQRQADDTLVAKKKALSADLFGEEVVTGDEMAPVAQYRTFQEELDQLLQSYADWETTGQGKKR